MDKDTLSVTIAQAMADFTLCAAAPGMAMTDFIATRILSLISAARQQETVISDEVVHSIAWEFLKRRNRVPMIEAMRSALSLLPRGEGNSSSVAGVPAEPIGSTEKSDPAGIAVNTELFPDFAEPLKGHLQYLNAALSWYDGSAADRDVKAAWLATVENLRDVRRAYMQVSLELASKIGEAMTTRVASSGVVVSSPSAASACTPTTDDPNSPLPTSPEVR